MHLKRLRVENFRALDNINVEFDARISVIIGPNAIGKTTILEAIRIAKGLLAPRTQNETNQMLLSLGATSPHLPQRLLNEALTNRAEPASGCQVHIRAGRRGDLSPIWWTLD